MTTYYTLARIGYWGSFEARCETETDDIAGHGVLVHTVTFVMMNQFGNSLHMGLGIFNRFQAAEPEVMDEDGETFPTLEAAIRCHADNILRVTSLPGLPMPKPMRHETWQGTEAIAFDHIA